MHPNSKIWAVVPAAGIGSRMAASVAKQYLSLADATVIECTLQKLLAVSRLQAIVVAVRQDDPIWPTLAVSQHPKIISTQGGAERADSVIKGLQALTANADANDWVLVHDAARPCVTQACIDNLIDTLFNTIVGGILSVPVADTLKLAAPNDNANSAKKNSTKTNSTTTIEKTVDRARMWAAQTPQMFRYQTLLSALLAAQKEGFSVTDEASAIEYAGLKPQLVAGRSDNLKITTPDDLALAHLIIGQQIKSGST